MPKRLMNDGFYQKMLRLALPIALQNLLTCSAQIVDTTLVVGLGNDATAGTGVAARWSFLFNLCLFGISSGCAALASQSWGAKDEERIHKTFGIGLLLSAGVGALFTLVSLTVPHAMIRVFTAEPAVIEQGAAYLRAVGGYGIFVAFSLTAATLLRATEDVLLPLAGSVISVVTNCVLSYMLIYGVWGLPRMGVRGAAVATVVASALQSLFLLVAGIARKKLIFTSFRGRFDFGGGFAQRFFRIMLPALGNEMAWALGTNVYMLMFARQGSENFAAYTIFGTMEQFVFILFVGLCHACAILVGKNVGAGETEEAYQLGRRFLRITPVIGVGMGVLLFLLRVPVSTLLPIETQGVRDTVSTLMLVYTCFLPFRPIPYICVVGIYRAGGDTKTGTYYDSFCLYCVSIPTVFVLSHWLKVPFPVLVGAMYFSEDFFKIILCLRHFKSRRWIRRLTEGIAAADDCPKIEEVVS